MKMNQKITNRKKRNGKSAAGILAICLGTAVIAGACGDSGQDSGKNMKMLMTISKMDTFRQTLADGAQQAAAERGIQLEVADVY